MREKKALWCILLTFVVAILKPGLCVRYDAVSDIKSLVCPPLKTHLGAILDIHQSMDLGAKLVEGTWQSTREDCVSQCCLHDECDMALYKNQGVSQSGKNCYFVKCGKPDNCVIVMHSGFTTVSLETEDADTDRSKAPTTKSPRVDSLPEDGDSTSSKDRSDMEPSPPASHSKTVAMVTATTPTQETAATTIKKEDTQKGNKEVTTPSVTPPTTVPPSTASSSNASTNSSIASSKVSEGSIEEANKALSPSGKVVDSKSHAHTEDCGKYGCDGSGVIAVAVVGSICFAIVVLVVAVLLKRVVDDKRKKRFNNVDYLINGMYT